MSNSKQQKHILIGGGSGFIGRALTEALRARGDRVTIVSRVEGIDRITWEQVQAQGIPECDVVINLAGKHILDMRRVWTRNYREEVIRSRVETTEALVRAINKQNNPPSTFISTAGKCFYGSQGFRRAEQYFDLDEYSNPVGLDFPSEVVRLWEAAAAGVDDQKVRHVKIRLGIVLGTKPSYARNTPEQKRMGAYGIFPMLHRFFKRGLTLSMGNGVQ
ncbi:MAG: NAD-dependent epimerase/dehydratase family protein, partial [Pseudomonadota bacterium]